MIALTGSGFAWGTAAFLAGHVTQDRARAATGAAALLAVATLLYYLLILVVSRRWSGGVLEDGTSGDAAGLRSVGLAAGAWLLGSLAAGPLLGMLGSVARAGSPGAAAAALGVACGLLSGEGWHAVLTGPPWTLVTDPVYGDFAMGAVASGLVRTTLPLVMLAWFTAARRLWQAWLPLGSTYVAAGATGILLWYGVSAFTTAFV